MRRHDIAASPLLPGLSIVLMAAVGMAWPVVAQDPGDETLGLAVRGLPLLADRGAARIRATVMLPRAVDGLTLRVERYGGEPIRMLAQGPRGAGSLTRTWDGRTDAGREVTNGAYRIVALGTEDGSTERAEAWVTVADRKVYPRRPGSITVVVDPGHGLTHSGAVARDGTREAELNLDISLRLARMLEGAGVNVVLTRTTDSDVNVPAIDRTEDGVADDADELAVRADIANEARADLFIAVHNNMAVNTRVGGPSTFFSDERPFSDRSAQLARIVQDAMVEALSAFETGSWSPFDHGALAYPYYVLRGYDPPRLLRPTQMPAVLSEGLFLSNPRELRMLKRPAVRQAMAEAYYKAIATYLARRGTHVGYELIEGPTVAAAGRRVIFEIEVRNQGTAPMRGWRLAVGAVPRPFLYEGRGRTGRGVAERRIPRLAPGAKTTLTVRVTTPEPGREWMLLFDARDGDARRASRMGSPVLQVPLTTIEQEPLATPGSAAPAASPGPSVVGVVGVVVGPKGADERRAGSL